VRFLYSALLLAVTALSARAIDSGTVKATFKVQNKPIELKYAYAHLHDNAEGILDRPRELRILLTDREVPREALYGHSFLPVTSMATEGKVQGLLFELDPSKPNSLVSTLLTAPTEPGQFLSRTTYSAEPKLFKRWSFTPQHVSGELERLKEFDPDFPNLTEVSFSVDFSVPVFKEPAVTADLKGKAAQASPQVQALAACARLLAAGDLSGSRQYQSERALQRFDAAKLEPAVAAKLAKEGGAELKRTLPRIQRVVVRGSRAVAMVNKGEYFSMIQEGGRWKMD